MKYSPLISINLSVNNSEISYTGIYSKRYNKSYPGELVHFDTKRLSLLKGQSANESREYLFVAIDDFSRGLYAELSTAQLAFS